MFVAYFQSISNEMIKIARVDEGSGVSYNYVGVIDVGDKEIIQYDGLPNMPGIKLKPFLR
jgi:hypothetical protein